MQGADGSSTFIADGSDGSFWSTFKLQPLEDSDGYKDDFRFYSGLDDVVPYIYQREATAVVGGTDVYNYYKGTPITLEGAMMGLSQLGFVSAVASMLLAI